jgi:arabinose-5-phosphate isomerase
MTEIEQYCQLGRAVIKSELHAIAALESRIDHHFANACDLLFNCKRRIVVIGMGKSGHIANKVAATFASTGTPAFYVHPGEASHGDMGMIIDGDVVLAISNSGSTPEILTLLPLIKRIGVPLISLTGNMGSVIAKASNEHLDISITEEACPLGLAPTSSTTASLVMCDALAVALLQKRGFTADDFALYHPGGALGRKLLLRVQDLYHGGDAMPVVSPTCLVADALVEITQKRLGLTLVLDGAGTLQGLYTDGDIRRTLDKQLDIHNTQIQDVMTATCKTIPPDMLAAEALKIMSENKISSLVVMQEPPIPLGILHLHDLLKAGVA